MKLIVLGATGGTGLEIVRRAIGRGHCVTAFVRSPEKLTPFQDRIDVQRGDLLNVEELAKAIQGHDAVISGFGPRVPIAKSDAHLLERFAIALTDAMKKTEVTRAVVISTAFLFKEAILPPAYLFGRLFFPGVVTDAAAMEQILKNSALDWTLVRPPQLTDAAYTGKYRERVGRLPFAGFKISRADVAEFMVQTAEDGASVRKVIGVSR
ncbi:MAG: SDR family oxidoreductase [Capsulimonas sp.]|uniref:NAD(P)-dependent oxidoreductase n=1 Tax=Capsulimonas sp. TaxID=2494211 RepID=UPI003267FBF8